MLALFPGCVWALMPGRTFARNTNNGFCVSFHLKKSNHLLDKGVLFGL